MSELIKTEPTNLIAQAIEKGATIETLEKLMALQERFEAGQNRKIFFESLSQFQRMCPVIKKTKQVSFKDVKYKYAPLSEIVNQIKDLVGECGLTYRWEIKDDGKSIVVNCIVTHKSGHSEQTSMSSEADSSGSKNAIQSRGSTITYLQRYTLLGALGISSADTDLDGKQPEIKIDELHKQYMKYFNIINQADPKKYGKYHPDNWKGEQNISNYQKAIAEVKKIADGIS